MNKEYYQRKIVYPVLANWLKVALKHLHSVKDWKADKIEEALMEALEELTSS